MGPDVLAAMAAGLSTGAKFTFLPAAGALCIGLVVISPAGQRFRRTIGVIGGAALTGGYWYLRNLIVVGNPLPSLDVGIGPFRLPHVEGPIPGTTVLAFLGNESERSAFLVSGLRDALGPVWPVVLLLSITGTVLAIARPDPRLRMLGVVAMTCNIAYLLTPQFVLGGTFFATNFRYAARGWFSAWSCSRSCSTASAPGPFRCTQGCSWSPSSIRSPGRSASEGRRSSKRSTGRRHCGVVSPRPWWLSQSAGRRCCGHGCRTLGSTAWCWPWACRSSSCSGWPRCTGDTSTAGIGDRCPFRSSPSSRWACATPTSGSTVPTST